MFKSLEELNSTTFRAIPIWEIRSVYFKHDNGNKTLERRSASVVRIPSQIKKKLRRFGGGGGWVADIDFSKM